MIPCLLVTADTAIRDVLKVGLDQTGAFHVDVAEDQWAIEMARSKPYRVVIADTSLSDGSDGLELLRRVREVAADAELLFIARNRNQSRHLGRDKQQLGLYGFIHVPVEPIEYYRLLARLLERVGAVPVSAS
ncbi:MAG: response regulator [Planctomycetes bacterium]|nr:response regulator [Planctomycetota bacterium]